MLMSSFIYKYRANIIRKGFTLQLYTERFSCRYFFFSLYVLCFIDKRLVYKKKSIGHKYVSYKKLSCVVLCFINYMLYYVLLINLKFTFYQIGCFLFLYCNIIVAFDIHNFEIIVFILRILFDINNSDVVVFILY